MSEPKFFPLNPEPAEPKEGSITTAACRSCDICDVLIAGMGGPGNGSICFECGTLIKRGMVKMDREKVVSAYAALEMSDV
ncbi:hypothetical protein [Salipiger sp. PrR003]|uniref:hypothetical protein n=1 Tax=Salipiger sp. PrR003 TaxID=2706776 RepID=UPI0013D9E264|nr:hypothetical protein [Salipiger sp. PrR003]NDV50175.1 hypothetical protein [Salipiger sp. PrR003]